jgi:hypothetical protein
MYKELTLTEPAHLSQESTNNLLQNVTRYVIPEVCANITRIQLYLQNATRSAMPPASAKRESRPSR